MALDWYLGIFLFQFFQNNFVLCCLINIDLVAFLALECVLKFTHMAVAALALALVVANQSVLEVAFSIFA